MHQRVVAVGLQPGAEATAVLREGPGALVGVPQRDLLPPVLREGVGPDIVVAVGLHTGPRLKRSQRSPHGRRAVRRQARDRIVIQE